MIRIGGIVRRRLRHTTAARIRSIRLAEHREVGLGRQRIAAGPRNARSSLADFRRRISSLRLIAADEEGAGTLTELGGEPAVVSGSTRTSSADAERRLSGRPRRIEPQGARACGDSEAALIDLTYAAEDVPGAPARSPGRTRRSSRRRNGTGARDRASRRRSRWRCSCGGCMLHDPIRRSVIQSSSRPASAAARASRSCSSRP